MLIIGITGTIGSGKGTVVEYLVDEKKFAHFSVRNFLIEEINKQKLPINRDSMVVVANKLREQFGASYIAEQLYEQAKTIGKNCIIESIRTPGEVTMLHSKGNFYLLALDAPPEIRYQRILQRGSETDKISYEEFIANEKREMTSEDPNKQNLQKCISMADFKIYNDKNFTALHEQIENILKQIS